MGYYVRNLASSETVPSVSELQQFIASQQLRLGLDASGKDDEEWEQVHILDLDSSANDQTIAVMEQSRVEPGELGHDEIMEFMEELADAKPAAAAEWLRQYLQSSVKVVYAFQILNAMDERDNWEKFGQLREWLWKKVGGIFQADMEGFSNEDGYHILWQFSDKVAGPWAMAVKQDGGWTKFQMDLGDATARAAFCEGKVPSNAKLL